ncbi:hypothetical protein LVY65_07240 [Sphingomonas sp. G124]|uniref:Uncharacterized protein n=1 Tax=Sphingomonas cremea TaxID=2904799 RepID=A0A9X1QMI5_9SPHN|nr:hypothetical protein [Sphingomonas cremea]MCF2514857.1 hypothetical protein [Sphingomonas cremea]
MQDPIYREAYPRLSVFEAGLSNRVNEVEFDRWLCRFWGPGRCVGELVILARTESTVAIDYWFHGPEYLRGRDLISLSLVAAPNGIDPTRQLFGCDDCKQGRAILAFKRGVWRCCDCHGLGYRSKLIDPQVRVREELAEIDARIPGGRRLRGMHGRTFRELRKRQAALRAQRGPFCEVSEAHRQVIRAEWLEVAKVEHMVHPGYEKAGDKFVKVVRPSWADDPPAPAPAPVAAKP